MTYPGPPDGSCSGVQPLKEPQVPSSDVNLQGESNFHHSAVTAMVIKLNHPAVCHTAPILKSPQ